MEGIGLGESPRWHDGRLWFSDWVAQEVIAVDLDGRQRGDGQRPDRFPFSIDWLPDGPHADHAAESCFAGSPTGRW